MGRQRRAGCRRRPVHHLHADVLFRQRPRRSSGRLDGRGRSPSPGRSATPSPARAQTVTIDPDTGDVDTEFNPRVLVWGASLQYSMPYLKSAVVDLGLPDFFNHLIPLVEASLQTPVSNTFTSGTRDHRHHQSRRHLCRQYLSGRRRSDDPGQPAERNLGRRHRAAALLPRRHLPQQHRQADLRRAPWPQQGATNEPASASHLSRCAARRVAFAPQRSCPRHARPCQPRGRQHRCRAPKAVTLWFTEQLEPAFSTIEVRNAQGAGVQAGKATVDPANRTSCACRSNRCRRGLTR